MGLESGEGPARRIVTAGGAPGHRVLAVSAHAGTMSATAPGILDTPAPGPPMIRLSAFADEISEDPAEQLDCLGTLGVKHVEFRSIFGTNVLDLTDAQHDAFRAMMAARGMSLSAIGSPIGKIAITDPFGPHLARFGVAMKLAESYETPRIRVFSYYLPEGDDPARHRDEVLRRMAAKAELARKRGLILVLENEEGIYGDNAPRVLDILESVGSPALSHAFDPANYLINGQSIDAAWDLLKTRVGHFHVKDYDPSTRNFVVAGAGGGQIPRLLAEAHARGFDGYATLEPHLLVAESSRGFTGPSRFADAARALQGELDRLGVPYA